MNGLNNDLPESGGWCDLRMKRLMEWTFEGGPKLYFRRVGADGNRTRYQSGVYVCTRESGRFVNLSGTAIIRFYYRLKEQQGMLFFEDGFLISILPLILSRRQDAEDRLSYLLEPV